MTVNREALARYLGLYAENVIREWMRNIIIDAHGTGIEEDTGARPVWLEDGSFSLDDFGRYSLAVTVTPLPELPPIGPENDPAQIEEMKADPEWMPATWRYVLKGDRVRLQGAEAEVTASNVGEWHVDASDYWRPKAWEHTEVRTKFKHTGDVWLPWPPDSAVEILMDGTRKAAYVLQQTFPGTREVK